jgi:ABC-type polysaccharide/polyol phosphate transport system ATPase subunit
MNNGVHKITSPSSAADEPRSIVLREVSKSYRLWRSAGCGLVSQLARVFSREKAARAEGGRKRNFTALRNISIEVAPGESLGIMGRNGSGKSTLLQIMAGLVKPTSGSGTVTGEVAALLELGTGFHPDFTGRESISLNNAIMGVPRAAAQERMTRIEAFADIGSFMDEPIRTYSSGMLLRLGFACAVAVDPDVFLVDEGLSVGDVFFQQKCYEFMREQMKGKTRVIVSHDMHAITTLCSRVLVLAKGDIVFDGPPLRGVEFYTKALHDQQPGSTRNGVSRIQANGAMPVKLAKNRVLNWRSVPPETTGGAGDVRISQFEVRVNEDSFASVVKPGDVVGIRMVIDCEAARTSVLFGYLMRDKMGTAIFGENSAGVAGGIVTTSAGESKVAFEFVWPPVQPGGYFLTLGAGEGRDPTRHRIQCWAHNLHLFNAISPGKPIHCLFSNELRGFTFSTRADEPVEAVIS